MIKIEVIKENNITRKLEAKGHAFFDLKGRDIVCSAISALLQNIYIGLSQIEDIHLKYESADGALLIEISNPKSLKEDDIKKINFLIDTSLLSMKIISLSYGTKIDINKKEV